MTKINYIVDFYYEPIRRHIKARNLGEAVIISKKMPENKTAVSSKIVQNWEVPIDQHKKEGKFMRTWGGMRKIRQAGFTADGVRSSILGFIKSSQGYKWKYHEFNK